MQVVQLSRHGGPEVLEVVERPRPEPGPGEVLVRTLAVSVNHLDLWARRGMPGLPVPLPFVPGSDGTAEVVECGEGVEGLTAGDRVLVLPGVSSGTSPADATGDDWHAPDYRVRGEHVDGVDQEYLCLEARYFLKVPAELDPVSLAAVPLVFLTAWGALVERAALRGGETCLVLAGASGVGSAGIQIAKDLGARVLTTAGSTHGIQRVGHGQSVETPDGRTIHTFLMGRPLPGLEHRRCPLGRETGIRQRGEAGLCRRPGR